MTNPLASQPIEREVLLGNVTAFHMLSVFQSSGGMAMVEGPYICEKYVTINHRMV